MRKFHIKFYYYTDLRTEWIGNANSDIGALATAIDSINNSDMNWLTEKGFRIEMQCVE